MHARAMLAASETAKCETAAQAISGLKPLVRGCCAGEPGSRDDSLVLQRTTLHLFKDQLIPKSADFPATTHLSVTLLETVAFNDSSVQS